MAEISQNTIGNVRDAGLETARAVRDKAADLTDRSGRTLFETIEKNPLLVAGVGLLVGGLIAGALPRSEIEDETIGDTSAAIERRAQAAAAVVAYRRDQIPLTTEVMLAIAATQVLVAMRPLSRPDSSSETRKLEWLHEPADLRVVSQNSPYMRNER